LSEHYGIISPEFDHVLTN